MVQYQSCKGECSMTITLDLLINRCTEVETCEWAFCDFMSDSQPIHDVFLDMCCLKIFETEAHYSPVRVVFGDTAC